MGIILYYKLHGKIRSFCLDIFTVWPLSHMMASENLTQVSNKLILRETGCLTGNNPKLSDLDL